MKKNSLYTWLAVGCSLLSVFSFSSCSKDTPEPDYAAGHVLEYGTDKPLSGAKVYLAACSGDFLGPISCEIIDSATALSDGSFTMKPGGSLVEAHMPGYFTDWESQKTVTTQPEDIRLYPHAWLRVKLKNESGAWKITVPGEDILSGGRSVFLSQGKDSTFLLFRKGNQEEKYIFSVIPEDGHSGVVDLSKFTVINENGENIQPSLENSWAPWFKVFLSGHDTTEISIIY